MTPVTDHGPLRQCLGGGGELPKAVMLRFVAGPDGLVHFDVAEKLPGRGAYVDATSAALALAIKRKALERKLEAKLPENLAQQVQVALEKQVFGLLGLLKRSGELTLGADGVAEAAQRGKAGALILATDAATATTEKFMALGAKKGRPVYRLGSKDQLSAALGQENCTIAALTQSVHNEKVAVKLERLARFIAPAGETKEV